MYRPSLTVCVGASLKSVSGVQYRSRGSYMELASTGKETPEREASYSQTRSVYSSIYTCTYEHVSSSSTNEFVIIVTSAAKCACLYYM